MVCCFKLLFYFQVIFVVRVEVEVAADLTTIFDNFFCELLHASAIWFKFITLTAFPAIKVWYRFTCDDCSAPQFVSC